MATIGILDVGIRANISNFEKGIKKADKVFRKFGGDMLEAAAKWGSVFGGAALAGLTVLVKQSMEAMDKTAKLSDRLGVSTEALIGLGHAAKLAGVDQEQLTKSLEYMTRTMGTLAMVGGQQADVLKSFGLDVKEMASMAPDQAFSKIADAISKQSSATAKATIAQAAFGRGGMQMIDVLNQGAKGLADATAEAESLGIMYSRVDASKVEQANDAVSKAIEFVTGLGNRIAIFLAPVVEYLSEQFIETGKEIVGSMGSSTEAFDWVEKALQRVADLGHLVMAGFYAITASFDWLISKAIAGINEINRARYALATSEKEQDAILKTMMSLDKLEEQWRNAGVAATDSMKQQWEKIDDGSVVQGLENVRKKMNEVADAHAKANGFKPGDEFKFPELNRAANRAAATSGGAASDMMKDIGSFMTISLSRTALGGQRVTPKRQEVHDPGIDKVVEQLEEANKHLQGVVTAGDIG